MEAVYINTGHPDFLNGHKAIALVTDRLSAKQQQAAADPKASKNQLAALQTNNLNRLQLLLWQFLLWPKED
jgi:hypothetical protein